MRATVTTAIASVQATSSGRGPVDHNVAVTMMEFSTFASRTGTLWL